MIVFHSSRIVAQPVAGGLPLGGVGGQLLGLGGQRLLAGGLRGAMLVAPGLSPARGGVSACSAIVASRAASASTSPSTDARRQALGQRRGGGLDLAGVAGARRQPLLHQRDLGVQVVEAPAEMGERGLGVAGLPGPDDPLACAS